MHNFKLFAVWGNPISHSLSPVIHQIFAKQKNIVLKYEHKLGDLQNFEIELKQFFQFHKAQGANITAPFKERAFQLLDHKSEICKITQACNTITFKNNQFYGDNTDGLGLKADLERLNWLKKGQKILILGAGGASKGIIPALLEAEQKISIYNRNKQKVTDLIEQMKPLGAIQVVTDKDLEFDLVINATAIKDLENWQNFELKKQLIQIIQKSKIYDLQYRAKGNTVFLEFAYTNGAKYCADGLGMLLAQASFAFEIWNQTKPDWQEALKILQNKYLKNI